MSKLHKSKTPSSSTALVDEDQSKEFSTRHNRRADVWRGSRLAGYPAVYRKCIESVTNPATWAMNRSQAKVGRKLGKSKGLHETDPAYEAFTIYRDLGYERVSRKCHESEHAGCTQGYPKVTQKLPKSRTLMGGVGSGSGDAEGSRSNASIMEMVASKASEVHALPSPPLKRATFEQLSANSCRSRGWPLQWVRSLRCRT